MDQRGIIIQFPFTGYSSVIHKNEAMRMNLARMLEKRPPNRGVLALEMIVVSDTSPLTALIQCESEELLPTLFDEVVIPEAVQIELLRFHPTLPNWLQVKPVSNSRYEHPIFPLLLQDLEPGSADR